MRPVEWFTAVVIGATRAHPDRPVVIEHAEASDADHALRCGRILAEHHVHTPRAETVLVLQETLGTDAYCTQVVRTRVIDAHDLTALNVLAEFMAWLDRANERAAIEAAQALGGPLTASVVCRLRRCGAPGCTWCYPRNHVPEVCS